MAPLSARILPYAIIGSLGFAHRLAQFLLVKPQLNRLLAATVDTTTVQLLSPTIWRQHFGAALWYLQQTPPFPNLIYGALYRSGLAWREVTYSLLALQAVISITTSFVLFSLLCGMRLPKWLAVCISLVFLLSGDLLVMEYQYYGQIFYEALSMLWVLLALASYGAWRRDRRPRSLSWLGLWIAVLALTRASFSWFFLVPFGLLLIERPRISRRAVATYCLPIVLLQGGWALKNAAVYGYFSLETSTWSGINMCQGDLSRPRLHSVAAFVSQHPERFAPWWADRLAAAEQNGLVLFVPPPSSHTRKRDHELDLAATLALGSSVESNSLARRSISQLAKRTYVYYWLSRPTVPIVGWWQSYKIFWAPIRTYTHFIPTVLKVDLQGERHLDWSQLVLEASGLERYRISQQPWDPWRRRQPASASQPAMVLALPVLPLVMHGINLLMLHVGPLLWACSRWLPRWRGRFSLPPGFSLWVLSYAYLAIFANVIEYGENQRFRLAVEPVIWLISCALLQFLWKGWRAQLKPASA